MAEGQVATLEFYDGSVEDSLKRSHSNSKYTGGNVQQMHTTLSTSWSSFLRPPGWGRGETSGWVKGFDFGEMVFVFLPWEDFEYIYKPRGNDRHRECEVGDSLGEKPRFLESETRLESSFSAEMERLSSRRCQLQLPGARAALPRLGPSHTSPGVLLKCRFCHSRHGLSARESVSSAVQMLLGEGLVSV